MSKIISDLTDEELEKEAKRFALLTGQNYTETLSRFRMLKKQGVEKKRDDETVTEYIKRIRNEQGKEKT